MPLQNRVTPFSEIIAVPDRGMFMGNRGCLHNDHKQIIKNICSEKRWIICQTQFNGRRRILMNPDSYTELFFLDEATALAAGHRPCATCRNKEYKQFKDLWTKANSDLVAETKISAIMIDQQLHKERLTTELCQKTFIDHLTNLPDGTFIQSVNGDQAFLWLQHKLHHWTPSGYKPGPVIDDIAEVVVLTPRSIVNLLSHGYQPVIHPSVSI